MDSREYYPTRPTVFTLMWCGSLKNGVRAQVSDQADWLCFADLESGRIRQPETFQIFYRAPLRLKFVFVFSRFEDCEYITYYYVLTSNLSGMISVLNIARSSCRGAVFKSLHSKVKVLGSVPISVQKPNLRTTLKCAPFFSTSHNNLSAHADHSHSTVWTAERFLSAGLVGLLPLSLAFPNPVFDYALALALTAHVHWGIEAIVVDYVRPSVVGAALSRAAVAGVYALSVFTLGGLFYFNYSDVGLSQAIRMLWKL